MTLRFAAAVFLAIFLTFPVPGRCDDKCEASPSREQPQKIETIDGVSPGGIYRDGRIYISGQPNESAFAGLKDLGLTVVVNVRTPEEIDDRETIPFDEETVVRDLGMSYLVIPLGGDDFPYSPAAVQDLAEILADNDGPLLIHCGYGIRAVYLWLAYLVRYEDVPLDQAIARGEAMMLKAHPMERMLGQKTTVVFSDGGRE